MDLLRSRDLRMAAISFVIVFGGLVFPWYASAFFHSSMPTYKYEVSSAVDGGNSNSWIKQESSFQDDVLKNFNVEHWLVFLIMHTPDNLHNLSLCGWIGSKETFTSSVMLLKMDNYQYAFDFRGKQFQFENNEPHNVTIVHGDVEIVIYPNEKRIITLHTSYGTFSFTSLSRGLPLWLARNEDEMIICSRNHVTGHPYYMGGFGDVVTVSGTVQDKDFEGYGLYCHWWTNEFIMQDWASIFVNQQDFYLMTWQSWNKTNPNIRYLNTGFLGFPEKNQYYSFDDFTFSFSCVNRYKIIGSYEKGTLDISGTKTGELLNSATGIYIHWNGILKFGQETIVVDAEGSGEIVGERHVWVCASFEYFPQKPTANEQITFNASASYSPGGNIASYEWNFDDGNTVDVIDPIISHTYALPGKYTVYLKVTDDDGLGNTTTRTIAIYFITDLNKDEQVNIVDIAAIAQAFGSHIEDPLYNPKYDIDGNGKINILDIARVAIDYGKSLSYTRYAFNVPWDNVNYTIILVSNSTVTNFNFNHSLKQIIFNVTSLPGTMGYCNISIPETLMWCDSPSQWDVTVDGSPINGLAVTEDTHTFLYFTYNHSTHEVIVKANNVISEFPSATILLLFMIITLLGFAKTSGGLRRR